MGPAIKKYLIKDLLKFEKQLQEAGELKRKTIVRTREQLFEDKNQKSTITTRELPNKIFFKYQNETTEVVSHRHIDIQIEASTTPVAVLQLVTALGYKPIGVLQAIETDFTFKMNDILFGITIKELDQIGIFAEIQNIAEDPEDDLFSPKAEHVEMLTQQLNLHAVNETYWSMLVHKPKSSNGSHS